MVRAASKRHPRASSADVEITHCPATRTPGTAGRSHPGRRMPGEPARLRDGHPRIPRHPPRSSEHRGPVRGPVWSSTAAGAVHGANAPAGRCRRNRARAAPPVAHCGHCIEVRPGGVGRGRSVHVFTLSLGIRILLASQGRYAELWTAWSSEDQDATGFTADSPPSSESFWSEAPSVRAGRNQTLTSLVPGPLYLGQTYSRTINDPSHENVAFAY